MNAKKELRKIDKIKYFILTVAFFAFAIFVLYSPVLVSKYLNSKTTPTPKAHSSTPAPVAETATYYDDNYDPDEGCYYYDTFWSSAISDIYYYDDGTLQVRFKETGEWYEYDGVPWQIVNDLLDADSLGAYFNQNIAWNYTYRKLP